MESLYIIVIIVILALAFDFINGFHDTANAIATSISTRALPPRVAVFYAGVLNFVGAVIFSGVAKTIGGSIADPVKIENGVYIIIATLITAIFWNLLTWYYAIPSSSSHTLIGSLAGAVVAGAGFGAVNFGGFGKIILILLLSPIIAFATGYLVMTIIKIILVRSGNQSRTRMNRVFRFFQIISAGLLSFSHGGNDAQKAMGIIVFALLAGGYTTDLEVPLWVKIAAATAMALGTAIGGWKIIRTVSNKIIKIEPMNGFASDLTSFAVIQTSTMFNMPLSTTHVITSAIIGTGSVIRFHEVKWATVTRMIVTWLITIPISMIVAFLVYEVLFGWWT